MSTTVKSLVALLFSCAVCLGQLPVIPFITQPNGVALPIPQQIPGLFEWWVAKDNWTTNSTVTNWFGRIQSTKAFNASASLPTNSTLGFGFGGGQFLTNLPLLMGTNWTVIVFAEQTKQGIFSQYPLWSDSSNQVIFGGDNQAAANMRLVGAAYGSGVGAYDGAFPGVSNQYDIALIESNSVAGGQKSFAYTNAQFLATGGSLQTPNNVWYGSVGGDAGNGQFWIGYIREILIYTNRLSSINLSNIHYYRTNTYGGSP